MSIVTALGALALAGCVGLAATPPPSESSASPARIVVDRQPGRYQFTALYDGPPREGLAYRLEVVREGAAGRSQSAQGGAVRGDTLSVSAVNVAPGDRVTARLTVTEGGQIVALDTAEETVGS